jgi:hypothetical protein
MYAILSKNRFDSEHAYAMHYKSTMKGNRVACIFEFLHAAEEEKAILENCWGVDVDFRIVPVEIKFL